MPIYTSKDFNLLVSRIKGKDDLVLKASKNTIDRAGRFAVALSIKKIISSINLSKAYVSGHIQYVKRPTLQDLTAVIRADMNKTLLSRYPHSVNNGKAGGGTVSVNKGVTTSIKGLRYLTLQGGERVIGLFNKDAVKAFKKGLSKGEGATPLKIKKYRQIAKRAKNKPYGRTPLFSRSINQRFESVRVDVQPELAKFMRDNFLKSFNRLNK